MVFYMYKIIDENRKHYKLYQYQNELEYERMVVDYSSQIFGDQGIYFDIKKKIGKSNKGAAIPDGYYLDLMFHDNPVLYFVEVELSNHDVYGHIGEQVLRFAISGENSKHKIKTILIQDINNDPCKQAKLNKFFQESKYNNINELLDHLIFEKEVSVIIVIDERTPELESVLAKIKISADIIEAQSYICGNKKLHRFSSFQDEVTADLPENMDYDELDTVVVPAREEGFKEEFLGNERWYSIRISSVMVDKIKYIAAYQVAPISAITYIAEVESIEKYKDTGKYMLKFRKNSVKQIPKILLAGEKGKVPQAPRYTSYTKLIKAKTLGNLWE